MDSFSVSECSPRGGLRNILASSPSTKVGAFLLLVLLPLIPSGAQRSYPPGYVSDNSDWWSLYVGNSQKMRVEVQQRVPAPSNFLVLGIPLESIDSHYFRDVFAKLGEAKVTSRSDGADYRDQICYVSSGGAEKVHLIFERGEILHSFYLFSGGSDWTGSDRCVSSALISVDLGTAAGIHLGQSRKEVETILGRPSATYEERTLYSFEGERTKDALVWTIDVRIDTRFENSKLTYLAVTRSEVN
jgi:hypothetical protein